MKVNKDIIEHINIRLTMDEAQWLMGYMQNPIPDISRCESTCKSVIDHSNFKIYEDEETRENRGNLFESLKSAMTDSNGIPEVQVHPDQLFDYR